jgi:hypothetical protein
MTIVRSPRNLIAGALTLAGLWLPLGRDGVARGADLVLQGPPVVTGTFHGGDHPLDLPRTRQMVLSLGDRRGTMVQWTAGPFVHAHDSRYAADSRLEIGTAHARDSAVVVLVPHDETHVAHGDRIATVSAAVVRPGISAVELQVGFLPRDASLLASGVYSTRVVGTITGY